MSITNAATGTNIQEVAAGIFRINLPSDKIPGGFSFNQYLILDDEPLLFHTGHRKSFELVREAVAHVMPVERLRYIGFGHIEADECGSLNEWLAAAPQAAPLCSSIAARVSINDMADRPARSMADGEVLSLGSHSIKWIDTPHLPHGWEAGHLVETSTRTLMCGDLFTQGGTGSTALTESDILESSEILRLKMNYFSHSPDTGKLIEKLASEAPETLACMHGSAWRGDGAALLRTLGQRLRASR